MRVLLLHHDTGHDITADAAHSLARGMASRGVTVDMVTTGARDTIGSELLWDGAAASEGLLTVHRVRCRHAGSFGYLAAALPVARGLLRRERYDVVHVTPSLPGGAMLPFLDLGGVPVVVSLAGSDVRPSPGVLRPLARWLWRRADRIIVPSESVGRLARRTFPELRYAVIPVGVDLARFRARTRASILRPRLRCLSVSPLEEGRGLDLLIRAVAAAAGAVELEIVGGGPLAAPLQALAARHGAADLVTVTGPLDRASLARRYREADLFALTTCDPAEVTPSVAEALASGLPLVGSALWVPEMVRDGVNGIFTPPGDVQSLAAAMTRLAGNPRLRAEMGRRNRAEAEERLSWERVTARHLAIYNGVGRHAPVRRLLSEQPQSTW